MADPKKSSTASSLLSTKSSLLSTKTPTLSNSSLLQGSSLLSSSPLNTTSSLLSETSTSKPSSFLSSSTLLSSSHKASSSSTLLNTLSKPLSSSILSGTLPPKSSVSTLFNTTPTSSSFLSSTKLSTSNTLLSSFNLNNSSLLTSETSLSRKRKAEPLESTVINQSLTQETLKKPTLITTKTTTPVSLSDDNEHKYNAENIQPESTRLNIDLHCHVPAPKRPRIDPFSSIYAKLESQNTNDDDFNVGIKSIKKSFLNSLADSLLSQPDLRKPTDSKRNELIRLANLVIDQDPEFILKAALYTRNHLNIRITANFLLAYAAYTESCRIFLKKYFQVTVNLPSDWIEIAELYQTFFDKRIHFGSLPSALRRVMVKKFPDFDKYQLAKYNKEKARLKKAKKANAPQPGKTTGATRGRGYHSSRGSARGSRPMRGRGMSRASSTDSNMSVTSEGQKLDKATRKAMTQITEEERETRRMAFTLKRLIRQLHISEPVEHVWCLLGKRYPETSELFYQSRLPGVFESERANKRMKLPTPETWETQISLKGNKAEVWQKLIDNKKLPFMAMLRNLRNMIKVGISEKHHQWVLKKLQDDGAVMYSRQFPFRFFSAYQILDELEEEFNKWCAAKETIAGVPDTKSRRITRKEKGKKTALSPLEKAKKLGSKEIQYDLALLQRYRKALDCSVKIATQHNCQPIPGRTFVFCNLSQAMSQPCQAARGLGKPRTRAEIGLLMGLMCKSACESSQLIIYKTKDSFTEIEQTPQETILNQMTKILSNDQIPASTSDVCIPPTFLTNMIAEKQWFDNIIIVSDGLKADTAESDFVYRFLSLYRYLVNPELMFVSIDLSIAQCSLTKSDRFNNRNDIFLSGFSDSILQFIAERGNDGQLLHVENIDNAHNLNKKVETEKDEQSTTDSSKEEQPKLSTNLPMTTLVPRWRTVRVFISSTFKDMHAERDLLTRYVFPELRQRAKSLFVNLYQTDLRWGIAESQSRQSVFLCLNEVYRSDYFIGLVGERYGYIPKSYDAPKDDPRFTWLNKLPIGYSITDLEMQAGALNSSSTKQNRAFFYLRDSNFLSNIPKPWSSDFISEDEDSQTKINHLKQRICSSGFETYNGYPCSWHGVSNDRPLVTNLEQFAQRVIDNLWTSLQEEYKPEYVLLDDNEIEDNQHRQYRISFMEHFVSRNKILQDTIKSLGKSSVILITGQQGSGKTAVIAAIADNLLSKVNLNVKLYEHYVGITRASLNSLAMLRRLLCQIINDHTELEKQFPIDKIRTSSYTDLCKILSDIFHTIKGLSNIVICIDGIELLDNDTLVQTLNFIPKDFNFEKITFIISATEDSDVEQACKKISNLLTINISNLELLERSEIVRKHLDRFGKKLDEQAFSSQMKFITSKRDSFKPSYLTLICEELLLMTDYEKKITDKLKAIPQRQYLFLLEIFKRLDTLFGETYVATVFGLIYSARQDLSEQELRDLINIYFSTTKTLPPPENFTYPITTTPLQLADFIYNCHILLKPQLYDGPQTVSIASNEIRQIVKTRYIHTKEQQINLYKLLAFYYWCEATGPHWTSMNIKAFEHLPYYLYVAEEYTLFSLILTNLKFIAGKCRVGLVQSIIDDYELIKSSSIISIKTQTSSITKTKLQSSINTKDQQINEVFLQQYRSFIQRNSHILAVNPSLIYQQALNELETSAVFNNIQQIISSYQKNSLNNNDQITAFVRINKPDNMEQIKYSIEGFIEPIRCLAISPSGVYLAAGSADCLVRLYNTSTSRLLKLFVGHAAPISALCFVGNDRLVSGSNDGGLSVWDVSNGHRLHILSPTHDKRVSELCSNQRGTQFASVSWDSFVRIWDIQKGRKDTEIRLHPKPVSSVAFHPDGFMLVTGCWDGIVRQWNVTTGQRKSVMRGHLSSIKAVAYSADGRYIASCSIDGECRLWNSLTGSQVGLISARISSIYFSPNGSTLASAGNDGRVRVFSSTIGQCQMIISNETWGSASSIMIHPEGEFIIAGYHSGSIRVFDIQNGTTEQEFHYHKGRIHRLGFSPSSGNILISASGDHSSRLYDLKDLGKRTDMRIQTAVLKGHTAAVLSCAISKMNMIATGSEDATICIYVLAKYFERSSHEPNEILTEHRTPITGLTFNNETNQLISASRDGQVHIWNINRYSSNAGVTLSNTLAHCHADWINDIALSNTNNGLLVTASNDNTLKIWNTIPKTTKESDNSMDVVSANVEEARVTLRGHQGSVNTVCFSYGCIVSGSLDNTIRVWSHKGTEITCLRGHTEKITSCDFWVKLKGVAMKNETDSDSRWANMIEEQEKELSRTTHTVDTMLVVSASEDGSVRVWRPTDPEQRCVYDAHAQPLNDIVLSNESIVTSSLDKTIRSWEIPTNIFINNDSTTSAMTPQVVPPVSHLDEVTSISVSCDNSLVFTVSRDAYLFIWSLLSSSKNNDYEMDTDTVENKMSKQPFHIIQSIKAHDETILGMALVRSNTQQHILVTGSVDKKIKIWTVINNSNEEKCSIKRLRTDTTANGPVSFVSGQYDMPYFVVGENQSFDSLTFYLYSSTSLERLKTYKTQTCQWPLSSSITINENKHYILTIGSTSNELCSYDLSLIDTTDSKLYASYASKIEYRTSIPSEWITSIENLDNNQVFYLGTTTGNIYSTSNLFSDIKTWNKNQISSKQRSITALCSMNNELIFTGGFDNVIRVQHRNDHTKHMSTNNDDNDEQEVDDILGQYPVPAPITQMRTWKQTSNGIFGVVAGDTLGNLYLVQWYSS
ncbi:unnamed protein product [Rotaria sp. Silwood2]|nr:unnamed protein product [Rotaria sp. Silwood2]CAF2623406.1 unnamed protein product [Rotaria sp. Silwood2]CAF3030103.1 unnamed protein product [Rotaria sp. Silwood2]CAF4044354.1 unnamed protein product [Rotaria sp. Silwood2]CAF4051769.1 unnamed protein product [Rotaria sp. Silwood2]